MTISVRLPDGRTIKVQTDDAKEAAKAGRTFLARERGTKEGKDLNGAGGLMSTFNKAVPGFDELADALGAVNKRVTGQEKSLSDAWTAQRAQSDAVVRDFAKAHPNIAPLATGTGGAAQIIPAFFTGGGSAAPVIGAAGKGLLARVAQGALVGGGAGYANGLASEGNLSERLKHGNEGAAIGAVTGGAIPVAGRVAGAVVGSAPVKTAVRAANRLSGGRLLNAESEAGKRLVEAMKADKMGASEIKQALNQWMKTGASNPALLDLLPAGGKAQGLVRAASIKSGPAQAAVQQYRKGIAADLQDRVIDRTRKLVPGDNRTLPQVDQEIQGRIQSAAMPPEFQPGQGGRAVSGALNSRYQQQNAGVNAAYNTARDASADQAHLPKADLPEFAANIREAVRDFHPDDVPRVTRALGSLDTLNAPTARDMFEIRSRLSNLSASNDRVEAAAAGKAVRALDAQIEAFAPRLTGDPSAVTSWQQAIAARRQLGQTFEGDDLINDLTAQTRHGAGRTNALAPEDASNALLGRNGVVPRADSARDLSRIRDMLGADSPEWRSLQQEASGRLLTPEAGSVNYGNKLEAFRRQNPEVAALLFPEETLMGVAGARQTIQGAQGDLSAISAGSRVLHAAPDDFAASLNPSRQGLNQLSAARTIEDAVGAPTEGATGLLGRLSTSTNTGRNLGTLFGDEEAANYRGAVNNEAQRLQNARYIDQSANSKTAGVLADEQLVETPRIETNPLKLIAGVINKVRKGATLTDAEREALVNIVTSEVHQPSAALQALRPVQSESLSTLDQLALPASIATQRRGE